MCVVYVIHYGSEIVLAFCHDRYGHRTTTAIPTAAINAIYRSRYIGIR